MARDLLLFEPQPYLGPPMEVTRQLRRERVDKKGLAPIQLTFCWDGRRLRLPAGQQ